ncbi:conserved hypothetical protein [Histoplasma capsulatum G186AR]|uniref:mRNA stability protein n=2 Tax=Ajellomyces capsulatus TaxID=5037 RepID=C0NQQ4_AJECG|nr:uncharacterized protein HCBG_05334 [Histoplasma capsulatum G186AR]EEH06018.1 conserved hypothetical protein [Histoplasma capsulatum G186AR]KAG5293523.1 cAMP-regulated phosphoprotein family protein Igo1 [Histoplasma capsulatum]QSS74974.1 cAMP-regulated phosphoprotein family protein Igo1 [Histoplasma capsulatum G186AR]
MNPHQQNKIDINSLSPDEQRLFRLYGKMPTKKDLLQNKLKERKYFDSGDYALSKAGKASDVGVTSIGSRHPLPENIPHLTAASPPQNSNIPSPFGNGQHSSLQPHGVSNNSFHTSVSRSPIKESSFLNRETSFDDEPEQQKTGAASTSPDAKKGTTVSTTTKGQEGSAETSPPRHKEGLPIRR